MSLVADIAGQALVVFLHGAESAFFSGFVLTFFDTSSSHSDSRTVPDDVVMADNCKMLKALDMMPFSTGPESCAM